MIKPVLLLDMDGIIADFNRHSIKVYKDTYNRIDLHEDLCNKYIGDHEVLDKSINSKDLRKPYRDPGFFLSLPVIPGSQEAVKKLEKYFNIFVLTTHYYNNQTCVYEKERWLERYFPTLASKGIFTKHKHYIPGDILIDDRPINLQTWKTAFPQGKTASLLYNWTDKNTDCVAPEWKELTDKILGVFNYV